MDDLQLLMACENKKLRAIMFFNFLPAGYLHPNKRREFLPEIPLTMWETPRSWNSLSSVILTTIGLPKPFVEPDHISWRIALLSNDRLMLLARYAGAVLMLDKIRASLSRSNVLSWKQLVGNDAYEFALSSASLLPRVNLKDFDAPTVSPEDAGYSLLNSAIGIMPDAVAIRLRLKIPPLINSLDIDPTKAFRLISTIIEISRKEWYL